MTVMQIMNRTSKAQRALIVVLMPNNIKLTDKFKKHNKN